MNDNILNAGFLALLVGVAVAAVASLPTAPRVDHAIGSMALPIVTLPTVELTARRQAPAVLAAVSAGTTVVQLPMVVVTGRRVPAMAPVTVAAAL